MGDRDRRWMVAQGWRLREEGCEAVNLAAVWTELGL